MEQGAQTESGLEQPVWSDADFEQMGWHAFDLGFRASGYRQYLRPLPRLSPRCSFAESAFA